MAAMTVGRMKRDRRDRSAVGMASDVGRVRSMNEDRALETLTLFAVADGQWVAT